jgi:hypothetical protein
MPRKHFGAFQRKMTAGVAVLLLFSLAIIVSQRTPQQPSDTTARSIQAQTARPDMQGRIAIIIDDAGYNLKTCDYLRDIEEPITISILPNLAYSKSIAHCAHSYGKEVFLHLPLESHQKAEGYPPGYVIKNDMGSSEIALRLDSALKSVPFVVGVNNHMGSRATEDREIMHLIFEELKRRDLFFVDSLVTDHSVCEQTAKEMNLPFAQRDVFLDNKDERVYIEGQIQELLVEAREKGYAVGIGHARDLTFQILKEQLPLLEKEGFAIVEVKDILKQPVQ